MLRNHILPLHIFIQALIFQKKTFYCWTVKKWNMIASEVIGRHKSQDYPSRRVPPLFTIRSSKLRSRPLGKNVLWVLPAVRIPELHDRQTKCNQPANKLTNFMVHCLLLGCETWMFIAVFTEAHHCTLLWVQFTFCFSEVHFRPFLPSVYKSSKCSLLFKFLEYIFVFLIFSVRATCLTHAIIIDLITQEI